jgi:hypothetical protein
VEFDHEVFGLDGVGAVDLDLVVALGVEGVREEEERGGG